MADAASPSNPTSTREALSRAREGANSWLTANMTALLVLAVVVAFAIFVAFLLYPFPVQVPGGYINFGVMILVLIPLYIFWSFDRVPTRKIAALTFFDKPVAGVGPGPQLVPKGIMALDLQPGVNIQVQIGTYDPPKDKDKNPLQVEKPKEELIDEENLVIVKMYDVPVRITFADYDSAISSLVEDEAKKKQQREKLAEDWVPEQSWLEEQRRKFKTQFPREKVPLHEQLTIDPQVFILFNIEDVVQFVLRAGDVWSASDQIRNVTRSTLQDTAGRYTVAMVMRQQGWIEERIKEAIEILIGDRDQEGHRREDPAERAKFSWGINLQQVRIMTFGLPYRVNDSAADNTAAVYKQITDVTTARGKAEAKKIESEAERTRLRNVGKGEATALHLRGEAEAKVIKRKLDEIRRSPDGMRILELENQAEVAEKAQFVAIVPSGPGGDLLGSLVGAGEVLHRRGVIGNREHQDQSGDKGGEDKKSKSPTATAPTSAPAQQAARRQEQERPNRRERAGRRPQNPTEPQPAPQGGQAEQSSAPPQAKS